MVKKKHEKVDDSQLVRMVYDEVTQVKTESFDLISDQRIDSNYAFANLHTSRTKPVTSMSQIKMYFTPMATNTLVMHQSKVFCSDKKTVEFSPDAYDEQTKMGADQLEKAVNKVLHRDNPGFEIITEMFRSAAVNKTGIAKTTWGEEREMYEEEFSGITEEQLAQVMLMKEEEGFEVEVFEDGDAVEEVQMIPMQDPTTGAIYAQESITSYQDYTLRCSRMHGKIDIEVIPPEEFVINEDTTSIHHDSLTRFVGHKREMYRGDVADVIKRLGSDADIDALTDYESIDEDYERRARHDVDGTLESFSESERQSGPASKLVMIESWIRADRDGDGYPEWMHVYTVGNTLLHDEPWFGPLPFTSFTFFPIPHKFQGLSVYDRIKDYEEAYTSLMRADIDMTRLKNTFRLFAKEGAVDRRTLQSGRSGIIPTSNSFNPQDVLPVPTPQGANNTAPLMAELRMQVAGEIGIDPINGMVSAKIEDSGNDAEKTSMAMDNATVKVEGYSRRFAEGALRDICWQTAIELVRNKDSMYVKELIEAVTPGVPFIAGEMGISKIIKKTDIVSKVGLGFMSGAQKIASSASLSAQIAQLEQMPSKANYYLVSESMKGWGYEHPEEMIGTLEETMQKAQMMQQQQQQAMMAQGQEMQVQQQQLQLQQQQFQSEMQLKQQTAQFDQKVKWAEAMSKIEKMEAETGKIMVEGRKVMLEMQMASEASVDSVQVIL